jgi:hypothetical protein
MVLYGHGWFACMVLCGFCTGPHARGKGPIKMRLVEITAICAEEKSQLEFLRVWLRDDDTIDSARMAIYGALTEEGKEGRWIFRVGSDGSLDYYPAVFSESEYTNLAELPIREGATIKRHYHGSVYEYVPCRAGASMAFVVRCV